MSRIAGVIEVLPSPHGSALLDRMLGACRGDTSWTAARSLLGPAALGWCGCRAAQLAKKTGLLAVLDGQIYNRRELTTTAGPGEGDAELLLRLYESGGFEAALRQLNGDFAAAVYDERDRTLWLGRDRFGIKPLYFVSGPDGFGFASRPRALLALPFVSREPNRRFVALFAGSHYRYFDNDPERCAFADIRQVPAAHWVKFRDGAISQGAYWVLEDLPDYNEAESALAERYAELLVHAVSLRLGGLERPAFTLSGGMDSSSVLVSAVRLTGTRQHAFSTVYRDATYDESREIRSMLDATVARWHAVPVEPTDVMELIRCMVELHDEPVATATWLSHYLLCQRVRDEGFLSLFGGLGGDELNAGEYEYFFYFFADLQAAGLQSALRQEVAKWVEYHDHPVFRKSWNVIEDVFARVIDWSRPGRCLADRHRLRRYEAALARDFFDLEAFEPVMDHRFRSYLKNRTFQDIFRETIPCCLRAEDRQTTAFGLDHVLPFFDHRLVEFMFRVPGTMKIHEGTTKRLLREAMRGILPEETRTRIKKTGWNAPAHLWFSGSGRTAVLDLVHSRRFRERGIYNLVEVERLVDEHEEIVTSGRQQDNHMMFLWQLVNLELWLESLDVR